MTWIENACLFQVKYTVKKDKIPIPVASGSADLCAELERNREKIKAQMEQYGVNDQCPFEKVAFWTKGDII